MADQKEYELFLRNTKTIVEHRVNLMQEPGKSLANEMTIQLFYELLSDEALEAIEDALGELKRRRNTRDWPNERGKAVHDLLISELRLFNALYAKPNEDGQGDDDLADAETVKGSIEDLLGDWLPEWLKKLFKLLNELLSLLRP